jgi:hypothetical protein
MYLEKVGIIGKKLVDELLTNKYAYVQNLF